MKPGILFWLCAGAGICAAAVLIALSARLTREAPAIQPVFAPSSASVSVTHEALQRCVDMPQPDQHCRDLWAASRRHFFGFDSASASSGDQP